jgi:tetratricopeptide (TPR) repeat protein
MRPGSVFAVATVLATVDMMSRSVVVAQTSKEWSQCSGREGPVADVVISGCSAVIQAGQDSANAYNNRGVIYRLKGEYDRAIKDYDEAIWLDSNVPASFYNRGIAYTEKQDYDHALGDFDVVLRFNPKNALALYARGIVRLKRGDTQSGAADIAAAKAINSNFAQEYEHSGKR